MSFFLILPYYLRWHYSQALIDLKNLWKNFVVFFYEFFSIPTLLLTLFSPWHRMQDSYSKQITFEGTVGTLIVNTLMRFVGAFVRFIFISLGLLMVVVTIILGFFIFAIWLILPFVLIYTFSQGIILIIS